MSANQKEEKTEKTEKTEQTEQESWFSGKSVLKAAGYLGCGVIGCVVTLVARR